MATQKTPLDEPVIGGPYSLFEGSFILEFLKPDPSRDATSVLPVAHLQYSPLTSDQSYDASNVQARPSLV